jgi:protein disulfide-isomerase A1
MKTVFALVLMAAAAAFAHDFETDGDVLVLDDKTFDAALDEFDSLLVEFYAPWCGHCKRLAPEYAQAATALKENDLFIAKVDTTANRELGDRFEIQGFPTLKFFRGGRPTEYNGGRTADAIVNWVTKKSGPPARKLDSVDAVAKFATSGDAVVVGYFTDAESAAAKAFEKVASRVDETTFAFITDAEAAASQDVEADSVVVLQQFDEGKAVFDGDLTDDDALEGFVRNSLLPLVVEFNEANSAKIFGGDVKVHFLFFADPDTDTFDSMVSAMGIAAASYRGEVLFITVAPSEDRVLQYFDLTAEDLPTAFLVSMVEGESMKKYHFSGSVQDSTAISLFVGGWKDGDLMPHLKSEEPTDEDLEGPVVVVKGTSFADIVLDEDKDVLLEFYAPWCGHCKQLAPKYEEVGQVFSEVDSVVIAKIDATANEVDFPGVNVQGFPTLYFFPAGKKKAEPYTGGREVDEFVDFIQKNANSKFDIPETAEHEEL